VLRKGAHDKRLHTSSELTQMALDGAGAPPRVVFSRSLP
jgi:hypothetical protein